MLAKRLHLAGYHPVRATIQMTFFESYMDPLRPAACKCSPKSSCTAHSIPASYPLAKDRICVTGFTENDVVCFSPLRLTMRNSARFPAGRLLIHNYDNVIPGDECFHLRSPSLRRIKGRVAQCYDP